MATYKCRAITKGGQIVLSKLTDTTKQNVIVRLKTNGLTPISVDKIEGNNFSIGVSRKKPAEKRNKVSSVTINQMAARRQLERKQKDEGDLLSQFKSGMGALKGIKNDDVIAFTQSLLLLKRANFTNVRALSTILSNTQNAAMRDVVEDILNGVEAGDYIYSTMEYYSKIFPEIYVSIVKVGELSGSLTGSLEQAMKYIEDSTRIKRSVKKALTGPLLQSGGLLIGSVFALIFGLPIMKDLYGQLGVLDKIPAATLAVSDFISLMGQYWYICLAVIGGLVGGFMYWKSTPTGKYNWDMFKLKMPVFGPLILRLQLQKFFTALSLNLANNARLQDAIEISKSVTGNDVLLSAFEAAQSNLQVGESWIEPFENMDFFPPMMLEMLRIGMETDITEMIDKIVEFVEQDIAITIEKLTKALPEIGNAVMGIILIGFVIIVLKPIMEVYMGSFLFDAYGM